MYDPQLQMLFIHINYCNRLLTTWNYFWNINSKSFWHETECWENGDGRIETCEGIHQCHDPSVSESISCSLANNIKSCFTTSSPVTRLGCCYPRFSTLPLTRFATLNWSNGES